MKKRILIALGVLVLAAGIGAGGWYYYTHHAGSLGGSDIVYVTKISKLSEMDSGVENRYAGVVEPQETVQIKIESGRKVKEVQVKTGQEVKKGDKLMEFDDEFIKANAPSDACLCIFTDLEDGQEVHLAADGNVKAGDQAVWF